MKPKIYIRKARSFGEVFGDTLGYIKQNFRSLFGSILLLVSPFVLLSIVLVIYLFKSAFAGIGTMDTIGVYSGMAGIIILMIFLSILGYTAFITVLNQHMILNDSLPPHEKVQMKDIVRNFFGPYLRGLGNMLLLLLISIVLMIVLAGIIVLLGLFIKLSAILGIFIFLLLYIFLLLVVYPIMMYYYCSIMFTVQRHRLGVFSAFKKVRRNLKDNFWITWAVSFLSGMITYFLSMIAFIPSYIIFIISVFTRASRIGMDPGAASSDVEMPLYLIILFCLSGVLMVCIYAIYFVMMNLQCASLEEKKEGLSILEKIESI